jgi:hypothetical protein
VSLSEANGTQVPSDYIWDYFEDKYGNIHDDEGKPIKSVILICFNLDINLNIYTEPDNAITCQHSIKKEDKKKLIDLLAKENRITWNGDKKAILINLY